MSGIVTLVLLLGTPAAAEQVVWQIGQPDQSYMEFAIAKDHAAYGGRFVQEPPVFEVGKSEPGRDWPFIHPGPGDGWAGSRVHPFTIRFSLPDEPRGVFTLRIELSDGSAKSSHRLEGAQKPFGRLDGPADFCR